MAPFFEAPARWFYLQLPRAWHDTPTSWLQRHFGNESNVCFVQIGAYDGRAGDPVRPLILNHPDWRGALIEPQTSAFAQLRQNYADVTCDLKFFNCAISTERGHLEMYEIEESEIARLKLPSWAREISSFSEAHVTRHFPNVRTSKRFVPVMTLRDVIVDCKFTRVDLIVMDVEGHEFPILDDVDFETLRVRALVFEHKHMVENEYEAALAKLKAHHFRIRSYGRDTVAYRSLI